MTAIDIIKARRERWAAKLQEVENQLAQLQANAHALQGALQACDELLTEMENPDENNLPD